MLREAGHHPAQKLWVISSSYANYLEIRILQPIACSSPLNQLFFFCIHNRTKHYRKLGLHAVPWNFSLSPLLSVDMGCLLSYNRLLWTACSQWLLPTTAKPRNPFLASTRYWALGVDLKHNDNPVELPKGEKTTWMMGQELGDLYGATNIGECIDVKFQKSKSLSITKNRCTHTREGQFWWGKWL